MNLDEVRELIRLMEEHGLAEIDVESGGNHIRLKAKPSGETAAPAPQSVHVYAPHPGAVPMSQMPMAAHGLPEGAAPQSEDEEAAKIPARDPGVIITSPIVGVFYAAPSPDKPPFVEAGAVIDENTVLCIIEAMKVMNEIKAETSGTVREILATNGQSVEYGQPLFVIDPA